VLTEHLRFLVSVRVLERKPNQNQQLVTYQMTPRGVEIGRMLDRFNDLAKRWNDI
jgi:DNA-binding HxlR family transcriptional regulator